MEIMDIKNRKVKVSSHSITVKGDNGKTCGIVKGIRHFDELRNDERMKYFHKLRAFGICGGHSELLRCIVTCDGQPYFLHNLKALEEYEKLFSRFPDADYLEYEKSRYNARKQAAEKVAEIATVIPCYVE